MVSNTELKLLKNLSKKRFREKHGLFVIEGRKLLEEAVRNSWVIRKVFCTENEVSYVNQLAPQAETGVLTGEALRQVTSQVSPSGILAVLETVAPVWKASDVSFPVLVLDGIRDPGNLGTILRSADWFGVRQVLCSPDCVDVYNPKVVQSTMGSLFRVGVGYADLEMAIRQLEALHGSLRIAGAALQGASLQKDVPLNADALVIGSESHGIRSGVLERCTSLVRIPGGGEAESLNASVAASILLYHWTSLRS